MSQFFPKPYNRSNGNIKVELDLSIYATKNDLKNATGVDASNCAATLDLASLKKVGEVDVNKLKTVPVDLRKLNDVVTNDFDKKAVYDELIKNILCNAI